jgi:CBS domain-containing protein
VMEDGTLVGMITVTDVLWAFLELSQREDSNVVTTRRA